MRTLALATNRLPAALIILCVSLALACAVLAGIGRLPLMAIVAPVGLCGALVTLREPTLTLALLPVIGVCVPYGLGTGSQSPIVAALLAAGLLVALGLLRALRTPNWTSGSAVTWPVITLILVWVTALLWSNIELSPLVTTWATFPLAQLGGTAVTIISGGVLLLAMQASRRGVWIQVATWAFIMSGVAALAAYIIGQQINVTVPFETGGLFTMWMVALSLGQGLFNQRLNWMARAGLIGLGLGWEYKAAVMQTWWFSGWLPSLIVIAILLFLRSHVLFTGIAALAGCVAALRFDDLYTVVWGTTVDKGDLSRLDIWQQSLDLFAQHPVLGTGPAGYAVYFQSTYAGSAFSMSTHNNYMDVLAQTGIVGAVVFAWLMITLLVFGWRARSLWSDGFYGGFAQGAFAGLLGLFIAMAQGDWFIPFVYNQTIAGFRFTVHSWVFLGFLAGLGLLRRPGARAVQRERPEPSTSRQLDSRSTSTRPQPLVPTV